MMTLKFHPDMSLPTEPNSLFVFGSNLAGRHAGGSARYAHDNLGAEWGVYSGVTGQCYAIPTCDSNFMPLPVEIIELYVNNFIRYMNDHPSLPFFVTRVGCGIAGFTDEQIAKLFFWAVNGRLNINVDFPEQWKQYLDIIPSYEIKY